MKSSEVREKFLKFFETNGHRRVKSSSLIPAEDPTLLFTNAGMVQFKDCFLGLRDLGFKTAATCQKCVRAGGKHNDLENVGFTPRHHTFFEMLGNFSFGNYFKKEAVAYAWELFTRHFALPKDRLYITVFEKDDEAMNLWKGQNIPASRISKLGEADNFWAMGETGPCGPCTEIHFDWGKEYGCDRPDCAPGCPCGMRFLEIANLVFMQYNRDASGKLTPLPKPSVDTGTGLERLTAVLQGKYSNYDTDVFRPLIEELSKRTSVGYGQSENTDVALRVCADHLRASAFLMTDGVTPSNEGRGYVLRRIIRRAIRYGKKLGQERPFLSEVIPQVVSQMGTVYPDLEKHRENTMLLLKEEEERFHETLHRGMGILEDAMEECKKKKSKTLSGDVAFKLYDTFGFPLDLIEVIAKEKALDVDNATFEKLMTKQRESSGGKMEKRAHPDSLMRSLENKQESSRFMGYETLSLSSKLTHLFDEGGKEIDELSGRGFAVFDATPFYPEGGGQVGDHGEINSPGIHAAVGTAFKAGKCIVHQADVTSGELVVGTHYALVVTSRSRALTARNHTATHLLHSALRKVLGDRVKQAGSLVEPERLRFDFTFPRALSTEEIKSIEKMVNEQIQKQLEVQIQEMPFEEATKTGALAFFDEKYGDHVRVVQIGEGDGKFSVELCGGTHLQTISEIGYFKIIHESSVASGVRRIEAITSDTAFDFMNTRHETLARLESFFAGSDPVKKAEQLISDLKSLHKENERLRFQMAQQGTGESKKLWEKKKSVGGYQLVAEVLVNTPPKLLRDLVDQVRDKLKEKTVVLLGSEVEGKVSLCLGLSKDLVKQWDASKLIQEFAQPVKGSGGGRPDFAQAGGTDASGLPEALRLIETWLSKAGS